MKINWLKNISGALLAISMVGIGGAIAQEENYSNWNTDGNEGLSYEEWDSGFDDEGIFDSWDSDGNGTLTEEEYNRGVYDSYDANNDGMIDEEEFGDYNDDRGDGGFWDV